MKQPKLSELKIDKKGTRQIRQQMAKVHKVKITINFDADLLAEVKKMSDNTGIPYQTLLNRLLRDTLHHRKQQESRLDRLEHELEKLRKKLVA